MDKRQVARLLQRAPWIGYVAQTLYRIFQPRLTVGAVGAVFNSEGRLLIVEHVFHPLYPWGLPGGWMGRHEEPAETVCREVREETGLAVIPEKPLLVVRTPYLPMHLDIAFLCRLADGIDGRHIRLSSELLSYRWAAPDEIPPMASFSRRAVEAALAARSNSFTEVIQ